MVSKHESSSSGYRTAKKYTNEPYLRYRPNFFLDSYHLTVCTAKIFFSNPRVNSTLVGRNLSF